MAKFKFRLATLLRLREAARDERRAELAEAYRASDVLRGQLGRVAVELGRLQGHRRQAAGPGTVEVDGLVEAQRYEVSLRARQSQLGQQHDTVATEIERRRETLVDADRDVRVLEKLREKKIQRHRYEEDKRQIKRLDEVAQQRAAGEKMQ